MEKTPLGRLLPVLLHPQHFADLCYEAHTASLRRFAERFIAEVRRDDFPELAGYLRIEERELEAGGLN
jgi:hypothetical protein